MRIRKAIWSFLNSGFGIAFFSLVVVAGGGKIYSDYKAEVAERAARRPQLGKLLMEFRHRVSELEQADRLLDPHLGPSPRVDGGKPANERTCADQRAFEKLSLIVGRKEQDIIRGGKSYMPTAPEFSGTNMLIIGSQIDQLAEIPDISMTTLGLFEFLDTEPSVLWIFTRAYMPLMNDFVTSRHVLYTMGFLPLKPGVTLNPAQEKLLGIPQPKPGDLERLQRKNDNLSRRLDKAAQNAVDRCK